MIGKNLVIDHTFLKTPPPDQKMPRIVSRLITLGYESKICKQVFYSYF